MNPVYDEELQKLPVTHYARMSCGCTVDFYEHEWVAYLTFSDKGGSITCPKCNADGVHMLASWKPTEREEAWS